MTNKAVKKTALSLLKNNWSYACTVTAVFLFSLIAVFIIIDILLPVSTPIAAVATFLATLLIVNPLFLGVNKAFWLISDGKKTDINVLFYYFSSKDRFKKSLEFSYNLLANICFYVVLLSIIPIILTALSDGSLFEVFKKQVPVWTISLRFAALISRILGVLIFIALTFKFYLAPFLFVANDSLSANNSFQLSNNVVKLTWTVILGHIVSFAFWILLSCLFLPLIFTLPYFLMSYITECRFSVAYYNSKISKNG